MKLSQTKTKDMLTIPNTRADSIGSNSLVAEWLETRTQLKMLEAKLKLLKQQISPEAQILWMEANKQSGKAVKSVTLDGVRVAYQERFKLLAEAPPAEYSQLFEESFNASIKGHEIPAAKRQVVLDTLGALGCPMSVDIGYRALSGAISYASTDSERSYLAENAGYVETLTPIKAK